MQDTNLHHSHIALQTLRPATFYLPALVPFIPANKYKESFFPASPLDGVEMHESSWEVNYKVV